ncbi:ABC transporter ATP-binding protein [Ignisphaera sp. 4213-co]|uniref:ABC transporter ATP-binding protein n=1 Tax=Ignisphaera cupida TaxID=3050454 RepID=A0ABD4Z4E4_9CREN|nr:ABC transporter ATP-binding protein [Ignisphaera sp. 4213-co]MDK6028192.1 ABC transporter ATP-binding protein [Ignisphaera sp. 4213-co]
MDSVKGSVKDNLLSVSNLKVYYFTSGGIVKAVDDVSFSLKRGEILGLAGESGSGKSTLGYALMRLVPPPGKIVKGSIKFMGEELTSMSEEEFRKRIRWKGISMIFQGAMNSLNPVMKIGDQIAEVFKLHLGLSKEEGVKRARELLKTVGLDPEKVNAYPHELSGGMKQRVVIAMALALNPPLVIADEPTTALDVVVQAQILNLLKTLQREKNMSMIIISHDLSLLAEISDYLAIMYAGKIVEYGSSDTIYKSPSHPYTIGLLDSIPSLSSEKTELKGIPGEPPDLINPPPGCRFHPRCPFAMDICRKEEPPMTKLENGHIVFCWLAVKR